MVFLLSQQFSLVLVKGLNSLQEPYKKTAHSFWKELIVSLDALLAITKAITARNAFGTLKEWNKLSEISVVTFVGQHLDDCREPCSFCLEHLVDFIFMALIRECQSMPLISSY